MLSAQSAVRERAGTTPAQRWVLALASLASFVVILDMLVVATALTAIRRRLGASLGDLEWTVNAYTLSFAVLLMTAAALGDRFGRRRVFVAGLAVFAISSAAFAATGSYASPAAFTNGFVTAFGLAAGIALVGALTAAMLLGRTNQQPQQPSAPPTAATTPAGTARAGLATSAR